MPADDRYVEVPSEMMFSFLESKGFIRSAPGRRSGREVVYERSHHRDSRYKVLIYTSVATGSVLARGIGRDAIRVVAIFEDTKNDRAYGVVKRPRIFRTGTVEGVLERVIMRAREAYSACNQKLKGRNPP